MKSNSRERDSNPSGAVLPRWLWLGLPLALALIWFAAAISGEDVYRKYFHGELGACENLTVAALAVAVWAACRLFRLRDRVPSPVFAWYVLFLGIACFIFAAEELSWGQHWLGFETPDTVSTRNDQGEFNLHNDPLLDPLFDFVARNVLTFAALIGGVVTPLVRRRRGSARPGTAKIFDWILPTIDCVPAALIASVITFPRKVFKAFDIDLSLGFYNGASESKELFLALFLMIYLLALLRTVGKECPVSCDEGMGDT